MKFSLPLQENPNIYGERGDANAMANRVMLHLLGYIYNLYTGIVDQLKTLNFHEIWNPNIIRTAWWHVNV